MMVFSRLIRRLCSTNSHSIATFPLRAKATVCAISNPGLLNLAP